MKSFQFLLGAKIIGGLGTLKHSLAILLIYLETIDLWVLSNDKIISENIPTIAFTCKFSYIKKKKSDITNEAETC